MCRDSQLCHWMMIYVQKYNWHKVYCPSKEDGVDDEDNGLTSDELLPVDFTFPPTTLPSYKPTNVWYGPLKSTGLTVILYNMDNIENVKKWEKSTAI
jgi:hypothetical protein